MDWYAAILPAALTAYLVRLYAVFVGPYYSWLEIVPELFEDADVGKTRRKVFRRRVVTPFVVMLGASLLFPGSFGSSSGAGVGMLAAALLLWPIVLGQPVATYGSRIAVMLLYALLFISFAASGWLGTQAGHFIRDEHGGLVEFLRAQGLTAVIVAALVFVSSDGMARLGQRASIGRDA